MKLELEDHLAVVTGGASGIGLGCARGLAREGCDITLWDVARDVVDVAAKLSAEFEVRAIGLSVDVSSLDSVNSALKQTESQLGPVVHLVHAAAVPSACSAACAASGSPRFCSRRTVPRE